MNTRLAALLAGVLGLAAMPASALTVQIYGDFAGGRDFDGQFEIAPKYLTGNKLPLAAGTSVPVKKVIVFQNGAQRLYFWGDGDATNPANNRYEAGAAVDRLILDDGQRTLTLEFASMFSGNGAITGGSVEAFGTLAARDVSRGVATSAVPLPGAVFGLVGAMAALVGFGRRRRRQAVAG